VATVPKQALTPAHGDERLARLGPIGRLMIRPEIGALIGAIAIGVFFALASDQFGTLTGAANWTDVASTYGIMSVPVALLMIGGEFDLSAGVMTGSTGLVLGLLVSQWSVNVWVAIVLTLLFAAAVGFLNGIMVVTTRLPSFIVTLATFFALQGLNLGITKKITGTVRVAGIDEGSGFGSARRLLASEFSSYNYKTTVLWWIAVTALATWVLMRTRVGNWIFAVGGAQNAARNTGLPVTRVKVGLFMTTSLAAGLVGIMVALSLRSVQAGQGVGLEFYYIIAAVVGGCLLTGGYGSAIGASLGALIIGMAFIGIPFAGWDSDWYKLFLGVILLAAVLVNNLVRRRAQGVRR